MNNVNEPTEYSDAQVADIIDEYLGVNVDQDDLALYAEGERRASSTSQIFMVAKSLVKKYGDERAFQVANNKAFGAMRDSEQEYWYQVAATVSYFKDGVYRG
jgi:hypothetical protein